MESDVQKSPLTGGIFGAEVLDTALMEMVKQDNLHQLSARVVWLKLELCNLLGDKRSAELRLNWQKLDTLVLISRNKRMPHVQIMGRENGRRSAQQSVQLPEEMIEDIVSRLPVRSLLKFKCVSKSWLSLIKSDRFIKKHLTISTNDQSYAQWLVFLNVESGLEQCSMRSFLDEQTLHLSPTDTNYIDDCPFFVVGSCNGVLCITDKSPAPRRFFLWNPATRVFIKLPELGDEDCSNKLVGKFGFGWDEESGAYKVFVGLQDPNVRIGKVYSSKTRSWRKVEYGCSNILSYGSGKFACGKIHWLSKFAEPHVIEYLDLKNEVFGVIEKPPCKLRYCIWLWEREGCLNLIYDNHNHNEDDDDNADNNNNTNKNKRGKSFWVMKEYGVKESWVEVGANKDSWVEVINQPGKEIITSCGRGFFCVQSLVSPS